MPSEPDRGVDADLDSTSDPTVADVEVPDEGPDRPIEPTPSMHDLNEGPRRMLVVIDWVTYAHLAVAALVLFALFGLTGSAVDSLTKIVIAFVVALALDTPVRNLQRRGLPRPAAVVVVCVVGLTALALVVALLGPPAAREAAGFADELPATLEELYDFPFVGDRLAEADIAGRSEEWLEQLPGTVTVDSVNEVMDRVLAGIVSVLQVTVLAIAILLDGELLVRRLRAVIPEHLRPRADRAGTMVSETLGRYFAGSLLLAAMSGTYVLTVGLVLGVPLVLLAAIWVAITDLIPQIGGFLGGSVFVVLALTQGAVTGVLALVLFVAYMSTENYLIHPAVVGRSVDLSPPSTMLAAIIGGTAAGVPGALVATPLVGSIKALYLAARHGEPDGPGGDEPGGDESDGDESDDDEPDDDESRDDGTGDRDAHRAGVFARIARRLRRSVTRTSSRARARTRRSWPGPRARADPVRSAPTGASP